MLIFYCSTLEIRSLTVDRLAVAHQLCGRMTRPTRLLSINATDVYDIRALRGPLTARISRSCSASRSASRR